MPEICPYTQDEEVVVLWFLCGVMRGKPTAHFLQWNYGKHTLVIYLVPPTQIFIIRSALLYRYHGRSMVIIMSHNRCQYINIMALLICHESLFNMLKSCHRQLPVMVTWYCNKKSCNLPWHVYVMVMSGVCSNVELFLPYFINFNFENK